MSYRLKVIVAAIFALSYASLAWSAQIYVIVNPDVNIESDDLKTIFLGEIQFSGSLKLELADNSAAQGVFLSKILGMSKAKYEALWVKKTFRDGVIQPPLLVNDAEVIDFVKKTPGAVGYVTTPPTGVKVVDQY